MFKECASFFLFMGEDLFENEKVLAFDLETTGISTRNDQIVQMALVGSLSDGTTVNYEKMVNPQRPIPYEASRIHGIHDRDVRGQPSFAAYADELAEFIEGAILVGHNVRKFDYAMLEREYLRIGRLCPKPKAIIDTLELVRRLKLPRPHNLGALSRKHGIRLEAAHTAAADAAATLLLFWRLSVEHAPAFRRSLPELERWIVHGVGPKDVSELGRSLDDLEPVDTLGKIRRDGEHFVVAFGRHKGEHVGNVHLNDPAYMNWLLSPNGIECEATRQTLREHLSIR